MLASGFRAPRYATDFHTPVVCCWRFQPHAGSPLEAPPSGAEEAEVKRLLDLAIAYLRRVHGFCYYCGEQFASHEELRYAMHFFYFNDAVLSIVSGNGGALF